MANGCQVCCCPTRVGILVGVAFALLYNLAFLGFIWGTANFTFGSADRATQFCSYPTNITYGDLLGFDAGFDAGFEADDGFGAAFGAAFEAAFDEMNEMTVETPVAEYRKPSVCTLDRDPCMCNGAPCTNDDFKIQITPGQMVTSGLAGSQYIVMAILALPLALLGALFKSPMLLKSSCCLIVLCQICIIIVWIVAFGLGVPYNEASGANRQYWNFWKNVSCSNYENMTSAEAVEFMNATYGIAPLEPLTAPDGPKDGVNDWCTSSLTGNAFGQPWQQARPHPADDLLDCPSVGAVPVLLIAFFIITCVFPVPLQTWLGAAITKFSSEVWREQGYDAKKKYPAGQA